MSPATLVTCHANADFDAFAAMLAARRLYAPCVLLFPGTQERGLQKLYARLDAQTYDFVTADSLDWAAFDRLVLVDTRQRGRVRHVAPLLDRPGLRLEVWDHHPDAADDVTADAAYTARVGALTSLMVRHLRERGIALTPEEATLLGLGIYGDTGSFTYSSTTEEDFQAASWLLSQGMDVNRIDDLAAHQLTSLHVQALNSLLESVQTYVINDVSVALAEASMEHYLGDFAYLAHRLMEMEKFTVLFAVGRMEDRIQVVARSRSEAVNVGDVCAALGGGGHAYAASASIRSMTLHEVRETILRELYAQAHPDKTARDYMSVPAVGIEAGASIREADELMLHFGLKAVPVFAPGSRACVGLLDAQTASRAVAHGLAVARVEEYRTRHVRTLPPHASLQDLTDVIVGGRQRLAPIVEDNKVVGVVTRTDLINVFANASGHLPEHKGGGKERSLAKLIQDRLPASTRDLLHLAGRLGAARGLPVYAVGGFVRDLLLQRPNQDIDLVVEGDGLALARELARELGGRVREHRKFLTSMVIFPDAQGQEQRLDVATARLEYYEHPAALPTVELSSLKMDLFRRDFSINALAVRLDDPFGLLVDFFGGQRDIKDKVIRVLHTLSFVEDPTRCLRAVRFEQRYGFHLGQGTEKLVKNALSLKLMDRLSPQRLFSEFKHICDEEAPLACFTRMDQLGIWETIAPQLALIPARKALLQGLQEILGWYRLLYFEEQPLPWLVYFLGLNHGLNYALTLEHYRRLGLPEALRATVLAQRERLRALGSQLTNWQETSARPSELCALLRPLRLEFLLYLMARTSDAPLQKNISRYITQWRREKADITGQDLQRLGLLPGPAYSRILAAVLRAKLDGQAPNAESQLALVKSLLAKNGRTSGGAPLARRP